MTSDPTAAGKPFARFRGAAQRGSPEAAAPTAPTTPVTPVAPTQESPAQEPPPEAPKQPAKEPGKRTGKDAAKAPVPKQSPVSPAAPMPGDAASSGPGLVTVPVAESLEPPPTPGTVVPPSVGGAPVQRGPRKARLQVRQVDPWSVMKLGFLLSLALGIVFVVAVALLWSLLDSGGVFDSINKVVADVANDQTDFTVQGSLAFRRVMGVTLVLAVVQVVLITALATLAAFLYNLAAGLVGGLDVTLVEEN